MRSVKYLLAAGAASLLTSTAVFAADMPSIMPAPAYAPPPVEDFGGWYLRGDIGMTNTRGKLHVNDYDTLAANDRLQKLGHGFSSGTSFGLGVGYQFNNWFRADITGEYRSKVEFHGTDFISYANNASWLGDEYHGGYTSWLGLVNAYADLGTWWCITPFVGVGVGAARITTAGFTDNATFMAGSSNASSYFAEGTTKTNLAWAAHAGLAYKVSPNFTVELAYRYLDMGTVGHGAGQFYNGTRIGQSSFQYRDLTSHDLKLGVRWNLDSPPAYQPPLMRKG